jgi:hypothetical protein
MKKLTMNSLFSWEECTSFLVHELLHILLKHLGAFNNKVYVFSPFLNSINDKVWSSCNAEDTTHSSYDEFLPKSIFHGVGYPIYSLLCSNTKHSHSVTDGWVNAAYLIELLIYSILIMVDLLRLAFGFSPHPSWLGTRVRILYIYYRILYFKYFNENKNIISNCNENKNEYF